MDKITIDFETYSEIDLKEAGAARYAQDSSTEVLCLAYGLNGEEPRLWEPSKPPPKDLFKMIEKGYLVSAFNAYFEYLIWRWVCVYRMGWPKIRFSQWRDVQAMAGLFGLPLNLDDCGLALGLDVAKDKRGKYLINKLCKPRKPSNKNPDTRWITETAPGDFRDLYEYCLQDVRAEVAVRNALPYDLPPRELALWRLTMKQNIRGLPIDIELVDNLIATMDEEAERLTEEIVELTGGEVTTGSQLQRMISWASKQGYEIKSMTADSLRDMLKGEDLPDNVKRMIEIRQALSKSSVKKFVKMKQCICRDGRIHGCLRYHIAPTGRWGGALIQPHNFPRESVPDVEETVRAFAELGADELSVLYKNVSVTASAMVRPSIKAPDGYELFDGDYSSIENCTVLWLADDQRALNLIRTGVDLYIDMAVNLHPDWTYQRIKDSYETDKVASKIRRHGKLTILGSVYGMAWKTFMETCKNAQFPITKKEAMFTIEKFREVYKPVVDLWYGLQKAAMKAITRPGMLTRYKKMEFIVEGRFLFMILPNGKRIAYIDPQLEYRPTPWGQDKLTITHGGWNKRDNKNSTSVVGAGNNWGRVGLSPGRLTENASQGLAREVLCDGLLSLESSGFTTILSVHDEAIVLAPENKFELKDFIEEMCNVSDFHKTIPIKASGFVGRRFKK